LNLFEKLFGVQKPKGQGKEIPTVPIRSAQPVQGEPLEGNPIHMDLPQLEVGCSQSVGKQRDHNEDALFTLTTNLASNGNYVPLGLYIVADGMGGHRHGEVASGLAVRSIVNFLLRKVFVSLLSNKPAPPDESIQEIMQSGMQEAHRAIMKDAPGSGTTLTAMLVLDRQMTIAHVGDSRAYAISPDGTSQILTRDHSLVMRMIELGQLTAEEAHVHPQRNVLYRALGQGEPFASDISTSPLPDSGYILLCSDGLWGVVGEEEIVRIINAAPSPQIASQLLVDAANTNGGPDNISAILIRLPDY
jgi:serine/threonine protein phosphatase PrpC